MARSKNIMARIGSNGGISCNVVHVLLLSQHALEETL